MLAYPQTLCDEHTCAYLPDRISKLEYTYALELPPQEYEDLMNAGYRKFGRALFRPICSACRECRPLRVAVADFKPDRSQRRAWKRNQDLQVRVSAPVSDARRVDLYNRYHVARQAKKDWPEQVTNEEEYSFSFVNNPIPSAEISLWEGPALRAIVLNDLTPNVVSAVYHFHDPESASRGLGTYCMLQTFELARRLGKRWVYFGFYVAGCGSLAFKATYRPHEILGTDGVWRRIAV